MLIDSFQVISTIEKNGKTLKTIICQTIHFKEAFDVFCLHKDKLLHGETLKMIEFDSSYDTETDTYECDGYGYLIRQKPNVKFNELINGKITTAELSRRTGLQPSSIEAIRSREINKIKLETLNKFCKALDLSIYLFLD
jgi:DNA-binding Xre family transcriptional regulator